MEQIGAAAVCVIIAAVVLTGFLKGLPVFELFLEGAESGLRSSVRLLPTLIGLITAIAMVRASGVLELFTLALGPALEQIGIHPELIPLILLRPLSGSGSVSYVAELYAQYGGDAVLSKTAAILSSATETTFYAAAVYFAGRGYRSVRYTIPAALCGDAAAVILTLLSVRLLG